MEMKFVPLVPFFNPDICPEILPAEMGPERMKPFLSFPRISDSVRKSKSEETKVFKRHNLEEMFNV